MPSSTRIPTFKLISYLQISQSLGFDSQVTMAGFNDLPNEIILGVWPHVLGPDDIASFALVSKRVFELGTSFLEEDRRLRSKYTIVENSSYHALAHALNDVLLNPHIAFYVRNLHVYNCRESWENPWIDYEYDDTDAQEDLSYPEPYMNLFRNEIRSADYLLPSESNARIQLLEDGHEEPIVASLLNLLPGLCTLKLEAIPFVTDLFTVVHRMIKKSSSESFPRLTEASFSCISSDENEGIALVKLFLLLPSVRKISCYSFTDLWPKRGIPDCIIAPRSALITELVFHQCSDITQGLSSLLGGIKALKKFTYVLQAGTINASSLHSTLIQHCRHSLQYLKLVRFHWEYGNASFTGTLGSLHWFKSLKELDLEFSLMVNPGAGREIGVPDSLPDSIEAIHILGRSKETDRHSPLIRSLVNAKRTGLLDLKRLSHRVFKSAEYRREPNVAYTDLCQQCGWHDTVEESE